MARRAKQDAEKTRTRILASALALFARKGYEHTTFTDVAARLKMTKGAVYWHFESKQALLLALVDEMLAKFHRQISELLPPGETSFEGLSFPVVADMMVRNALRILEDPKGTAFFLLIHEQIKWADASMTDVRNDHMQSRVRRACRRTRHYGARGRTHCESMLRGDRSGHAHARESAAGGLSGFADKMARGGGCGLVPRRRHGARRGVQGVGRGRRDGETSG